jgi:hypothetical protein
LYSSTIFKKSHFFSSKIFLLSAVKTFSFKNFLCISRKFLNKVSNLLSDFSKSFFKSSDFLEVYKDAITQPAIYQVASKNIFFFDMFL